MSAASLQRKNLGEGMCNMDKIAPQENDRHTEFIRSIFVDISEELKPKDLDELSMMFDIYFGGALDDGDR